MKLHSTGEWVDGPKEQERKSRNRHNVYENLVCDVPSLIMGAGVLLISPIIRTTA